MNGGLHPELLVADETLPFHGRDRHPLGGFHPGGDELAGPPRPLALVCHGGVEAGLVHRETALGGHHPGQVQRKPVGVVEAERIGPQHLALRTRAHLLHDAGENIQAAAEGAVEVGLLRLDHLADVVHPGRHLRELRGMHLRHRGNQPVNERLVHLQQPAVA